jgi:pimeloyl-ACP methyl ester carboxylesterase
VERSAVKLPFVLLTAATLALAVAPPTTSLGAEIELEPCSDTSALACGHLSVPLSPSGAAPGSVRLTIRRRRAPIGNARSAVIAPAGGPGQAAIPFTEAFAELLGPILSTRDLIVFDQRGTGLSGALTCPAFKAHGEPRSPAQTVMRCADQIGPSRGFYTTAETVADIEAIRVAGGYEKLVLYGTSYGTKVALQYAQAHPSHVEALVLDSVVEPNGPDPLHLGTFAAVPHVLRELCAFRSCAHITRDPVADLRRAVARMGGHGLRGIAIDGHGRRHTVHISSTELLNMLVEGDVDPLLRAETPAAIRAAADGDAAPIVRMLEHAAAGEKEEEEPEQPGDPSFDNPLFFATICEEEPFPWSRAATAKQRIAEAVAKIRSLPTGDFAPFSSADVLSFGDMRECAAWPFTRPAPPVSGGPLPAVPTLIISGAEDLRTPTSGARAIAAAIPGSHLLVVPNTGHSALTTEPQPCALDALHALFEGSAIKSCRPMAPPPDLKPTPLAPSRLSQIKPTHRYAGRVGRTLAALGLTLVDVERQLLLAFLSNGSSAGPGAARTGGLRRGWAAIEHGRIALHRYTYVPGVEVSGWIGPERAELRIAGRAAANGVLRLDVHRHLVGELAEVRVDVGPKPPSAHAATAARSNDTLSSRLAAMPATRALERVGALAEQLQCPAGAGALQAIAYALTHTPVFEGPLR